MDKLSKSRNLKILSTAECCEYLDPLCSLYSISFEYGENFDGYNKIPENYCTGWKGTEENINSLNKIMEFYEYLTA